MSTEDTGVVKHFKIIEVFAEVLMTLRQKRVLKTTNV
jgi:hypothetical protein